MSVTPEQVEAGQAVYSRRNLGHYDFTVLGVSNRFIWRCPTPRILQLYNEHASANHLDVGVGTGYFLDHCRFPSTSPRVALADLNPNSLAVTAERIARYQPETYQVNVLDALPGGIAPFDSIAINYLLHCLPGTMQTKEAVIRNLLPLLNPGGTLFGATLLTGGVRLGFLARRLMAFYNRKGIFSNEADDLETLITILQTHFAAHELQTIGCAALFWGRKA